MRWARSVKKWWKLGFLLACLLLLLLFNLPKRWFKWFKWRSELYLLSKHGNYQHKWIWTEVKMNKYWHDALIMRIICILICLHANPGCRIRNSTFPCSWDSVREHPTGQQVMTRDAQAKEQRVEEEKMINMLLLGMMKMTIIQRRGLWVRCLQ